MFMLNGNPLPVDTPFTVGDGDDAIQYPANWLRLASAEEKAAIGVTEVPDPVRADDRFYWDGDITNPKPVEDVRKMLTDQITQTAYTMLLPTDWQIVRRAETGTACDQSVLDKRAAIRTAHTTNLAAINAALDTPALATLVFQWPTENLNV